MSFEPFKRHLGFSAEASVPRLIDPLPPDERGVAVMPPMQPDFAAEDEEPTGVLGTLREMPVAEVVQTLAQGMKDALVEVRPRGEPMGVIGIERGRVVYAQSDDRNGNTILGEEAFFKLFCANRGAFRIRYGRHPAVHNIDRDPTWLLLEGARRLDEDRVLHPALASPPEDNSVGAALAAMGATDAPAAPVMSSAGTGRFSSFFDEAGVKAPTAAPSLPIQAQRFHSVHVLDRQVESIIDDVESMDSDRTMRENKHVAQDLADFPRR